MGCILVVLQKLIRLHAVMEGVGYALCRYNFSGIATFKSCINMPYVLKLFNVKAVVAPVFVGVGQVYGYGSFI